MVSRVSRWSSGIVVESSLDAKFSVPILLKAQPPVNVVRASIREMGVSAVPGTGAYPIDRCFPRYTAYTPVMISSAISD